jgi:hypothetical protein
MKKLQIPIEDELMAEVKAYAAKNQQTLKELIITSITSIINGTSNTDTTDTTSSTSNTNTIDKKSPFIIDTRDYPEGTHIFITEDHAYDIYRDESPELPPVKTSDFYLPIEERENPPLDPNDPIQKMLIDAGMS